MTFGIYIKQCIYIRLSIVSIINSRPNTCLMQINYRGNRISVKYHFNSSQNATCPEWLPMQSYIGVYRYDTAITFQLLTKRYGTNKDLVFVGHNGLSSGIVLPVTFKYHSALFSFY